MMLTPLAVLRLKELAKRAGVTLNSVYEFEKRRRTPAAYIEAEGIRLLFGDAGAPAGIPRRNARIDL